MFEGPAARQKAFEKSMIKVESQLQKGQEHAKEQLAAAQQQLDNLSKQSAVVSTEDDSNQQSEQVNEENEGQQILSVEERLQLIEGKGYSIFQSTFEKSIVVPTYDFKTIGQVLGVSGQDFTSDFSDDNKATIKDSLDAMGIEEDLFGDIVFADLSAFRVKSLSKKKPTIILLTSKQEYQLTKYRCKLVLTER